jgi:SnoaL-like domain
MTSDVLYRLDRLEAIKEIERLKIRYAEVCDAGYEPAEIGRLLTDDAVWDGGSGLGRYEGKEAVCGFFGGASKRIVWALHYMVAPVVEVDEDLQTARGSWYLWQPCTIVTEEGPRATLITGRYADAFRREPDGWKFSEIVIDVQTESPLDEGWVRRRFLSG